MNAISAASAFKIPSPMVLAERREQALMLQSDKKVDPVSTDSSAQNATAEKIARGGDPKEVLGIVPDRAVGDRGPTGSSNQDRVSEAVSRGADPEALFAAIMGATPKDTDGSRDLQIVKQKQDAYMAQKEAHEGYAKAAQAFQDRLTHAREAALDMRIGA
jgi:hypothetical protein